LGTTNKENIVLSDNIWWTRQSRIRTERRLLSNAFHSQVILLWYSFYSVAVSIYYLNSTLDAVSNKYWLIYSILVLVVSVYINGFSFKERASLIKENYEHLKTLASKASTIEAEGDDLTEINLQYEKALNSCENHLPSDYLEALYDIYQSAEDKNKISPRPTEYQEKRAESNRSDRKMFLGFFYSLPVIITVTLNADKISIPTNWLCQ
jgi:hypothetical protein